MDQNNSNEAKQKTTATIVGMFFAGTLLAALLSVGKVNTFLGALFDIASGGAFILAIGMAARYFFIVIDDSSRTSLGKFTIPVSLAVAVIISFLVCAVISGNLKNPKCKNCEEIIPGDRMSVLDERICSDCLVNDLMYEDIGFCEGCRTIVEKDEMEAGMCIYCIADYYE